MLDSAKLRELRNLAGLSQEGLAELIGVDWHTVWSWENEKIRQPRLDSLLKACRVLKCKLPDVYVYEV